MAGFKHRIKTEEAFKIVPELWSQAWNNGTMNRFFDLLMKTDYRPAGILGIAIGGQGGNSIEMDYFMGVTNHVETDNVCHVPAPDGMEEIHIKSATWVIIQANGALPDAVQKVYKQFYSEWLPGSNYQLDDLPIFECYMQDNRQEVWVAVKDNKRTG